MLSDHDISEIELEMEMAAKLSSDVCDGCRASEIVRVEIMSHLSRLRAEIAEYVDSATKWREVSNLTIQICMPMEYREWNDANPDATIDSLTTEEFIKVVRSLRGRHEDAKHAEIRATAKAMVKATMDDVKSSTTTPRDVHNTQVPRRHWPTLTNNANDDSGVDSRQSDSEQTVVEPPEEPQAVPMMQGLSILDDLIVDLFGQGQPTLARYNTFCGEKGIDAEKLTLFIIRNGYFDFCVQKERGILFPQTKLQGHLPRLQTYPDFVALQGNINLWTELGKGGKITTDMYVSILGELCERGFTIQARIGAKDGHAEFFPGTLDGQSALLCIGNGEPPYIPVINVTTRFKTIFLVAPNPDVKDLPKLAGHTIYMSEPDPIDWRN